MTDKTEVEAELAALKARVAELEQARPPKIDIKRLEADWPRPPNPIDRLAMPASVLREMAAAVPDQMVREIARDRAAIAPSSMTAQPNAIPKPDPAPMVQNKTGYREAVPLAPPPGQELIAGMCDAEAPHGPANPLRRRANRENE
jgi:hypothetical protein